MPAPHRFDCSRQNRHPEHFPNSGRSAAFNSSGEWDRYALSLDR
jgi:hypothetical protein